MVIANFTTKSGMKVTLEGNSEEISNIIDEFERRQKRIEDRRLFFGKMMETSNPKNHHVVTAKMARSKMGLTDFLLRFLNEGFFDSKKKIRDIMNRFEKEGINPPTSTVHPLLGRLVLKCKLNRTKNEEGVCEYSKKQNDI